MEILTFYDMSDGNKKKIYIASQTEKTAIKMIQDLNEYSNTEYDLFIYDIKNIDENDYMKFFNIDEFYIRFPKILTKNEYKDFLKYIINKDNVNIEQNVNNTDKSTISVLDLIKKKILKK